MSSSDQILPPGSPLQRTRPQNSRLVVAVTVIVAVHVFLLAGLLIQGCQRQDSPKTTQTDLTNGLPPLSAPADEVRLAPVPQAAPLPTNVPAAAPAPQPLTTTPTPVPSLPTVASAPAYEGTAPSFGITRTPDPAVATTEPAATITYVVKVGDNLTKIARNHNTTAKAIRAANNLKTDRLLVGQKLKVSPGKPGAHAPTPVKTVKTAAAVPKPAATPVK